MTLSVFNVLFGIPVPGQDPTLGQLERVELPSWITLSANAPEGTKSVEFTIGDSVRVDNYPPFLLNENGFGTGRWEPAAGDYIVSAKAFAEEGALGALLAETTQTISYHERGVAPDFQPLSEAENAGWVAEHLEQVMQPKELTSTLGVTLPYRLFVPPDYDAEVRYPLLVFLHDRDARGSDNGPMTFGSSLFHGERSIVSPNFRHEFPAIILVPQCPAEPADQEWGHWYGATAQAPRAGLDFTLGYYPSHDEPSLAASLVKELVDATLDELSVDPTRVYLTGESMGGLGTWDIAWRWPQLWAAAVPLAGFTDPSRAKKLLDLPLWVFHSTLDTEDNVVGSLTMVDKLKVLGGIIYYTQYDDVDHAHTFERVWRTEKELYPWIWANRRTP